jgi:methylmalonyl-CoA mutase N-terminal domain/subunit
MANKARTTKEILQQNQGENERIPLYNPEALEQIRRHFSQWSREILGDQDRENWWKAPKTVLGSDVPRELVSTPLSCPDLDYQADLGNPGEEPFTRGIHPNMYRGRSFTMRQLTGFGSPKHTNERMKFMLDHGATGLNVLFDLPTIQMYDSDDPMSAGQVGMSGVCIDSIEDMDELFRDIPLDQVSISIVTHYPSNTAILFPMFLALAEERGIPWEKLRGSVQNDTTLEQLIRSGAEYIPPEDCFRLQCDNIQFLRNNVPKWNFTTLNGYNLREFGTSAVTEMAVAAANGIATLEELQARGHDLDDAAGRLTFFWSVSSDIFEEIARLRAMRRLWHKIMKYRFGARNKRSLWMRCHIQTSGVALVQQEPLNNVIRSTLHALAAILGGTQSLHVDSYDEAYSVPTEEAALLSLRTQQIIGEETGITDVVDPLGGSFYIEALTADLEQRILDELEEIEQRGGYVQGIADGSLHRKIVDYFSKQHEDIEKGEIRIVGLNAHISDTEPPPVNVFSYPEGVEEKQREKLAALRTKRDQSRVERALNDLERACLNKENVVPYSLECARARCTEGELFRVFKRAFGSWNPPTMW